MTYQPIPSMLVIALGHKARQGKDTVAQFLFEAYPGQVLRIGFADALKTYCRVEHGMEEKDGALLQRVGLNMRQTRHPDIWINALYWTLRDRLPRIAIITDMRFKNEAAFVRDLGGITINVRRFHQNDHSPYRLSDGRDPNHPTEIDLDDFKYDYTLDTFGELSQFRLDTLMLVSRILQTIRESARPNQFAEVA